MANITDPLITSVQGSDPQNLMEYITRQKIYDCRFWKEECFGLTVEDVLEKSANILKCIGGTFGGNSQPTKFLCLVLKLLQLQPSHDLITEFINQDYFKYVKALGIFYLRLTGKPNEIYELLEPLYGDYSKLKVRQATTWKLLYMDEFVTELLNSTGRGSNASNNSIGIALPRLPMRETLQESGYLDDGPRFTGLQSMISEHGGLEEYLAYKAKVERNPTAIALYEKRTGDKVSIKKQQQSSSSSSATISPQQQRLQPDVDDDGDINDTNKRGDSSSSSDDDDSSSTSSHRKRKRRKEDKPKKKKQKYSSNLFTKDKNRHKKDKKKKDKKRRRTKDDDNDSGRDNNNVVEGSDEYWNEQRAALGLKPLRK